MQRLVLSFQLRQNRHIAAHQKFAAQRPAAKQEQPAAAAATAAQSHIPARYVLLLVFSGNFIGIVCARTLHYQFYSW
jgi:alpha-1,3-mannosyltransferase